MSKSEPVDPMPFATARTELWRRLVANAGLDSNGNPTASADPEQWDSKGYTAEEYFHERLWGDALVHLAGAGIVGLLRVWEVDGSRWRRIPHESILGITHNPDEAGRLYIDREEFETSVLVRHPSTPASSAGNEPSGEEEEKLKRGRPKGPGYSLKDELSYQKILKIQRDSGNIRSKLSVVQECSGNVNDHYYGTNVERLRKGLKKWLEKNGHEWNLPN